MLEKNLHPILFSVPISEKLHMISLHLSYVTIILNTYSSERKRYQTCWNHDENS